MSGRFGDAIDNFLIVMTAVAIVLLLVVMLGLGDINLSNYLMVEQVKHTFSDGQHLMECKMRGGTFVS